MRICLVASTRKKNSYNAVWINVHWVNSHHVSRQIKLINYIIFQPFIFKNGWDSVMCPFNAQFFIRCPITFNQTVMCVWVWISAWYVAICTLQGTMVAVQVALPATTRYDSKLSHLSQRTVMGLPAFTFISPQSHVGLASHRKGFVLGPLPVAQSNYRVFSTKGCSWFWFPRCWVWSMWQTLSLTRRTSALHFLCFVL